MERLSATIKSSPVTAVAAAAGLGLALGLGAPSVIRALRRLLTGRSGSHRTSEYKEFLSLYDWGKFGEDGRKVVDFVTEYYASVHKHPVKAQVAPNYLRARLPNGAPEEPESLTTILDDVRSHIMPGITHWQHPRFFAYFPANSSPPGALGDILSGMFNVIGFSWVASPACTELEAIVLDWLATLIGLPESFKSTSKSGTGGGVIQGTASEATLVALLAARAKAMAQRPAAAVDDAEAEAAFSSRLVFYTSAQAHSSVDKARMIAGVSVDRFRKIATVAGGFEMDPAALAAAVEADRAAGLIPCYVCATLGTTSSGAFDPIRTIGELANANDMWLHVDAAWAGSAYVCPEFRDTLDGIELADSIDFNPHKWLLTNFDLSAMFVKDSRPLAAALSLTPVYLRSKEYDEGRVIDLRDQQIPLGRRFRSLKLWLVLRQFGARNLRAYIREHVALAQYFEELVQEEGGFELVCPRSLALVCIAVKAGEGEDANALTQATLDGANDEGATYVVPTNLGGRTTIRVAVGNPRTTMEDVKACFDALVRARAHARAVQVEAPGLALKEAAAAAGAGEE